MKTISSETTFTNDPLAAADLGKRAVAPGRTVSGPRKRHGSGGYTVVLKLKTGRLFASEPAPNLAGRAHPAGRSHSPHRPGVPEARADGTRFRLLVWALPILRRRGRRIPASLIDTAGDKRAAAERAMDKIRAKFGR